MRLPVTKALIVLAITTTSALGADNSIGTWKLNIEKSHHDPPPFPLKSLTTVREAADGGVKVGTTGQLADASPITIRYTAKYNGNWYRVSGISTPYDTISVKQVNANRFTDECKRTGGSYHATDRTVISNGGKLMTTTTKGTTVDGKEFTSVLVFDKQ
jgi:hypothetical protein